MAKKPDIKLPLDDIIKAAMKAVSRVKNRGKMGEASLLSPMSKKKFEKIYGPSPIEKTASRYSVMRGPLNRNVKDSIKGATKKDNVVLNMYAKQYKKKNVK